MVRVGGQPRGDENPDWMIIPHFAEAAKPAPVSLRNRIVIAAIAPTGVLKVGGDDPGLNGDPREPKVYLAEMQPDPEGFRETLWPLTVQCPRTRTLSSRGWVLRSTDPNRRSRRAHWSRLARMRGSLAFHLPCN